MMWQRLVPIIYTFWTSDASLGKELLYVNVYNICTWKPISIQFKMVSLILIVTSTPSCLYFQSDYFLRIPRLFHSTFSVKTQSYLKRPAFSPPNVIYINYISENLVSKCLLNAVISIYPHNHHLNTSSHRPLVWLHALTPSCPLQLGGYCCKASLIMTLKS